MSHQTPFAAWPEEVRFSGSELDVILNALDYSIELAPPGGEAFRAVRRGQVTVWRKLWPELADHYDDLGPEGEE